MISTSFNNERLKGKPRYVATRVFRVSTRVKGEVIPIRRIHLYDADSPHSSDRWFTECGEPEREIFYDYPYKRIQKAYLPVECGDRIVLFDVHNNPTRKWVFYTEKRSVCVDKNSRKSEEITETKEIERSFENSYDEKGRLIQKVEHYRSNESDRKPFARTYTTAFEYDGKDRVTKCVKNDCREVLYIYDGERLATKEWRYMWHVNNLFESGVRYEKEHKETYEYDDSGNLVEIHYKSEPDGHCSPVDWLEKMEYDSMGTLVRKTVIVEDFMGKSISRYTYKNNTCYYIQTRHKPKEGKRVSYRVSKKDDYGNVILLESRSKVYKYRKKKEDWRLGCVSNNAISIDYTYDKYGNWTRKDYHTQYSNYIVTREIEYYE